MKSIWTFLSLPLLTKELVEQAARRRTYIIRTVYAVLLCGLVITFFYSQQQDSRDPLDLLGTGRKMLQIIIAVQAVGIALFVPALTCGAITAEKETNTFGLLLLTRLSPTTILMEKFLGRVFTMLTFLLLSFPLLGFCYALGGVQQQDIWLSMLALVTMVVQLSALGVMCSAIFRTTVSAFIATYLLGFALHFGPPILLMSISGDYNSQRQLTENYDQLVTFGTKWVSGSTVCALENLQTLTGDPQPLFEKPPTWRNYQSLGQEYFFLQFPVIMMAGAMFNDWTPVPAWMIAIKAIPAWLSALLFLQIARFFIVRRAFISPKNYLISFFRWVDAIFHHWNQKYTRGVVLVNDSLSLPIGDPVAWREVSKKSLGTFRYLLRILLAIEFPVLALGFIILSVGQFDNGMRHPAFIILNTLTWALAVLLVVVKSATVISGERSSETLNVLLSTPLASQDIIRQKLAGIRRLCLVVAIPVLSTVVFQTIYAALYAAPNSYRSMAHWIDESPWLYAGVQLFCMMAYLPMISWLCLLVGLIMKTQVRAIFASLALVVAWIVLPFVLTLLLLIAMGSPDENPGILFLLASPAFLPAITEMGELRGFTVEGLGMRETPELGLVSILLAQMFIYVTAYILLRTVALNWAPHLLGRLESPQEIRYRDPRSRVPRGRHVSQETSSDPVT